MNDRLIAFFLLFDTMLAAGVVIVLICAARLSERILKKTKGDAPGKPRIALTVVLFASFVVLSLWILNHYWLPHKFHPLSLVSDLGLLVVFALVGYLALAVGRGKAVAIVCSVGAFLLIFSAATMSMRGDHEAPAASPTKLSSLPYLTWVPAEKPGGQSGVVLYDTTRAFRGVNLYNSRNLATAHLMDMSGGILHSWSARIDEGDSWFDTELCGNGDLLAIVKDKTLLRLDWNSNVLWSSRGRFHHDITIGGDGDVIVLSRKDELRSMHGIPAPVLDDYIFVVSEKGKLIKEIPLFPLLKDWIPARRLAGLYAALANPRHQWDIFGLKRTEGFFFKEDWASDLLHSNTVETIKYDVDDVFRKGRLLYCSRMLDLIGVIDLESESMVWTWGPGILDGPHHPTQLENGNILIFDNGSFRRRFSRIVELDPRSKTIVWEYESDPPKRFFSQTRGACQRLPNGNTLITNSDKALAFEITRDGTIVWEFRNPEILDNKYRAAIYRLTRFEKEDISRLRN